MQVEPEPHRPNRAMKVPRRRPTCELRKPGRARNPAAAGKSLDLAAAAAAKIGSKPRKLSAYLAIVSVQASVGDMAGAEATATKRSVMKASRRGLIAGSRRHRPCSATWRGRRRRRQRLAERMSKSWPAEIAVTQAKAGDADGASERCKNDRSLVIVRRGIWWTSANG